MTKTDAQARLGHVCRESRSECHHGKEDCLSQVERATRSEADTLARRIARARQTQQVMHYSTT